MPHICWGPGEGETLVPSSHEALGQKLFQPLFFYLPLRFFSLCSNYSQVFAIPRIDQVLSRFQVFAYVGPSALNDFPHTF